MSAIESIRQQDFERIHLFQRRGRKLCLDVNSARVVRVSDAAWDLLSTLSRGAAGSGDDRVHSQAAVDEVDARIAAGSFFTEPQAYDPSMDPLPVIDSAILNLTHRCNLGCAYCFMEFPEVKDHYGRSGTRMPWETAVASLAFLREHGRQGTTVTFFGGEPLLEFDLLRRIVEHAETAHAGWFRFNIISNGTLMSDEIRGFLDEHRVSMIVSLDGTRTAHNTHRPYKSGRGSYDDILKTVSALHDRPSGLKVNVTYTDSTADVQDSYEALRGMQVRTMRFEKAVVPPDDNLALAPDRVNRVGAAFGDMVAGLRDRLVAGDNVQVDNFTDILYRANAGQPRRRGCDVGVGYVAIAADGGVYPCHKFIGNLGFRAGDVWTGFDRAFGQQIWNRPVETRTACKTCWARHYCGGYCVADNHLRNSGDFFEPDPASCDIIRSTVEQGIWLHEELREQAPQALQRCLGWKHVEEGEALTRSPRARVVESARVRPEGGQAADGEALTVDVGRATFRIGGVGRRVWALTAEPATMAGLCRAMVAEHPSVDRRLVEDDVRDIVTKFVTNGVLMTSASTVHALDAGNGTGCENCECQP